MKLFKVKNTYSGYSINTYLIIAENRDVALSLAGEELKQFVINNDYDFDEKLRYDLGLKIINIEDHIDQTTYLDYFEAECLSFDTTKVDVISAWGMR